jgi:endonuclease-3
MPGTDEKRNARVILNRLKKRYPVMRTALDYRDAWQLVVATVLSAQTTDENVNRVAPHLFDRWPTPEDLAGADPEEVEQVVFSTGFYRQKTKSFISLALDLVERYAEVWDIPAIAVDTHVKRVTNRLGLTRESDPQKIEYELRALHPKKEWSGISMRYIQFGREVCDARRPLCWQCPLADRCEYPDKTRRP